MAEGGFHSIDGPCRAVIRLKMELIARPYQLSPSAVRFSYVLSYLLPLGRFAETIEGGWLDLKPDPLPMIFQRHPFVLWSETFLGGNRARAETPLNRSEFPSNLDPCGLTQLHAGFRQEAVDTLKGTLELTPWLYLGMGSLAPAYRHDGGRERGPGLERKHAESNGRTFRAALYYAAAGEEGIRSEALKGTRRQGDLVLFFMRSLPFFGG